MLGLLAVKAIDVIIGVGAAAVVLGVIIWAVIRKKQGKSVSCDCSSCEGCQGACPKKQQDK